MSALLTSETGNTAKVVKYINECREMGIPVLPPDVNASDLRLHARRPGAGIRFGLGAIKNVGGERRRIHRQSPRRTAALSPRSTISANAWIWAPSTAA